MSRRFFYTRSGRQATYLLGLHHLDHGQPLAGALALAAPARGGAMAEEFEPALSLSLAACWLRQGAAEQARQLLVDLQKRDPSRRVTVAGREVPLFTDDSQAIEWFRGLIGRQPAAAGASQRDAAGGGAPLLSAGGEFPSPTNRCLKDIVEQYQRLLKEHEAGAAIPTLHPLAVGDVLLMRTLSQAAGSGLCHGQTAVGGPGRGRARVASPDPSDEHEW